MAAPTAIVNPMAALMAIVNPMAALRASDGHHQPNGPSDGHCNYPMVAVAPLDGGSERPSGESGYGLVQPVFNLCIEYWASVANCEAPPIPNLTQVPQIGGPGNLGGCEAPLAALRRPPKEGLEC
ncbi:hypothetical protein PCANC_09474 [Puccinia coronata f. sp. avenae]|uniref:Uncharacterized protein n=1 Tax=Puccinia coronata f. sp. avenae TaxID=200324 RepID=A0A2N5VVL3_9BASI|nr:hypothetical protein PCANC_09474 [Puccinia coronata f. sp. avenae]